MAAILLHATAVALHGQGLVIQGASASGKSSLALHLIEHHGAQLISDDQTKLSLIDGTLHASPPEALRGLIEVRGLGLLRSPFVQDVPVAAAIELVPADTIERLPVPHDVCWLECRLPHYTLAAHNPMTPLHAVYALRLAMGKVERAA